MCCRNMRVRWARGVGLSHVNIHILLHYIIDIKQKKKRERESRGQSTEACAVKPFSFSGTSAGSLEFLPVAVKLDFDVAMAPTRPKKMKTKQVHVSCYPGQAVNLLSASIKKRNAMHGDTLKCQRTSMSTQMRSTSTALTSLSHRSQEGATQPKAANQSINQSSLQIGKQTQLSQVSF